MGRNRSAAGGLLTTVILTLLGGIMIFYAVWALKDHRKVEELKKLYTREVTATAYKVEKYTVIRSGNPRSGIQSRDTRYRTDFTYTVGKTKYKGQIVRDADTEEGTTFTLYTDPNDPSKWLSQQSIDSQGERMISVVILSLLGSVLIGTGIVSAVGGIKRKLNY